VTAPGYELTAIVIVTAARLTCAGPGCVEMAVTVNSCSDRVQQPVLD
jgi:hypothetical protein